MITTISTHKFFAIKEMDCMACEWMNSFNEWREDSDLTTKEKAAIRRAKKNGYKIIVGQSYNLSIVKQEGEIIVFKAIPEINAICKKYKLYPQ